MGSSPSPLPPSSHLTPPPSSSAQGEIEEKECSLSFLRSPVELRANSRGEVAAVKMEINQLEVPPSYHSDTSFEVTFATGRLEVGEG